MAIKFPSFLVSLSDNRIVKASALDWTSLRSIGENPSLKWVGYSGLLIPLAARFTQAAPDLTIELLGAILSFSFELPFNWIILFSASAFLFTGNIIYAVFCPKFIRSFDSYFEYIKTCGKGSKDLALELMGILDAQSLSPAKKRKKVVAFLEFCDPIEKREDPIALTALSRACVQSERNSDAYRFVRRVAMARYPVARFLVTVIYTVAVLLLIFLFIQNCLSVWGLYDFRYSR